MSSPSSNATSPSTSSRYVATPSIGSAMGRSGSSRSLFRDSTRMPTTRSRQNTLTGSEDLVRNLGSDYQEIQKRTLTKWVNAQLEPEGDRVENIETDLKDGKRLLKLLSIVSKESAPKPERMNMRIHQLANVAQALAFLENQLGPETMPDIGNEAIVNGDPKKTVALVFFIMLRYQIQLIITDHGDDYLTSLSSLSERKKDGLPCVSEVQQPNTNPGTPTDTVAPFEMPPQKVTPSFPSSNSLNSISLAQSRKIGSSNSVSEKHTSTATEAKTALLYWVRIQLEDYIAANIIPSIQDFSRSWRTGAAFCLLIHRHDPYLIPDLFTAHVKGDMTGSNTWFRLLKLAFDLADTQLGIRPYLAPEDLVEVDYPHEPSVMMYVSEFYKVMSRAQREESENSKRERAMKRRANIASVASEEEMEPIVYETPPQFMEGLQELKEEEEEGEGEEEPADIVSVDMEDNQRHSNPALQSQEPPAPVSTLSARRNLRKNMQRHSSLGEEDKARIKADLNTRLMMQLTGHLPRGVHPVLDQLLTIHEDIMTFIRTNTNQIDNIPENFKSSSEVADHIEWLEELEMQTKDKSEEMDIAKDACQILTAPPEKADETFIRLTDLQRSQVEKLFSMLCKQWGEFIDMIQSTQDDLQSVEEELAKLEKGILEYQNEAYTVQTEMTAIENWVMQELPVNNRYEDAVHPLDGTRAIVNNYKEDVQKAVERFDTFDTEIWRKFRHFITRFPPKVLQSVSARQQQIDTQHDELCKAIKATEQSHLRFEKGVLLATLANSILGELSEVQKLMDNDNYTTDGAIQDLEKRTNAIRIQIYRAREECEIVLDDERCIEHLCHVEEHYERVQHWVDQVREWFAEAERIRRWITSRIAMIHERNENDALDPLSKETPSKETLPQLIEEHEKLKREVDRFNTDDMTRLRAHVRKLTSVEDRNRNLSPADTSTIEITLTTLNTLDQLLQLLAKRTLLIDMLKLRIRWEEMFDEAAQWIENMEQELDGFIRNGARWFDCEDVDDLSVRSSVHIGKRKSVALGGVINTLTDLEERIAEFDSGSYTNTLDAYQDMEDLLKTTHLPFPTKDTECETDVQEVDSDAQTATKLDESSGGADDTDRVLPEYLENRQSVFEKSFEETMKRSHFSRKVVEQHLSVADVIEKILRLHTEGERLEEEINMPKIKDTVDIDDEDNFGERVQNFKDSSDNLITLAAKGIAYPKINEPDDKDYAENEKANQLVRESVDKYAMALATVAERLEDLLTRHRQSSSLQQRATFAHEDMIRMTEWMNERVRTLEKTTLDLDTEECPLTSDVDAINRLKRERDGMAQRVSQMEDGDLAKLMGRVRLIEEEIGASNAVSVDQSTLISGIEQLEQSTEYLKHLLTKRTNELSLLEIRSKWEKELATTSEEVAILESQLWGFIDSGVNYDSTAADGVENIDETDGIFGTDALLESLQKSVNVVKESMKRGDFLGNEFSAGYALINLDTPTFIQTEKDKHALQIEELSRLSDYASEIDKQRKALRHVLSLGEEAKAQGYKLHENDEKLAAHQNQNITLFLGIIDRLDDHLLQLSNAIDKAAPHHARIVNDRFQKTDLQQLLRELVATYKENEPKVSDLLAQAKSEAQKQLLDDNERVAKRLQKTTDRWSEVQAAASSRERDLQTYIHELNHEFFTKLAKAKSTPRTNSTDRKARRASFQARSTLPQPVKPLSASPRRGSFKSTTLAVDNRRRSRTPSATQSFPRTPMSTYVPDPKNELDVHLSKIVNESAYRMKIKMVPGEVGKYWFGEDHPRLMYCRVLPSKLVMLRVGGGWVELSKFLKDHGRNDVSSNRSDTSETTAEGEDTHMIWGRGTTARGRSGSVASTASSLHLSHSAKSQMSNGSRTPAQPSGYVEDGKYIRVDEDGNQVAMKMTKAKDTAKTPSRRFS